MNLIACLSHKPEFFRDNNLSLEAHIPKDMASPDWEAVKPFIRTVHLPYSKSSRALNLASFDDAERNSDIQFLEEHLRIAASLGTDRTITHTCGLESIEGVVTGCYERMIDALQHLADYAASLDLLFCIENMCYRAPEKRHLYGSNAAEWLRIYEDVDRPNVRLTLDSSHATSSIIPYKTHEERKRHIFDFLKYPERIAHVHWSDSRIANQDALFLDLHLIPGDGDLPIEFHKALKRLDATKLLEQHCSDEDTLRGVRFIEQL